MNDKETIRLLMLKRRSDVLLEDHNIWSLAIAQNVLSVLKAQQITQVGSYFPFRNEPNIFKYFEPTQPEAFPYPLKVLYPKIISSKHKAMAWGEPPLSENTNLSKLFEPAAVSDLPNPGMQALIIPCVAFSLDGFRIGYGGGYYDFWLKRFGQAILPIGVAFSFQEASFQRNLIVDYPLSIICTEKEIIHISKG